MASDAAADRGQVAVITGATGFSRAAALEFGERGWNVAMISHRMEEVQKTLDMVKERSDVETLGESGEAGDESTMRQFMQHVQAKWGRLDAVCGDCDSTLTLRARLPLRARLHTDKWKVAGAVHGHRCSRMRA